MTTLPLYRRKPRRKRIGPEARLQYAVIDHLRIRGQHGMLAFSVPNEGKRSPAAALHLKLMGMWPGIADIVICKPKEQPKFLELKARGEKQTWQQMEFQAVCEACGFQYACCDNIKDALAQLEAWGALRPDRAVRRAA